MNPKSYTSKTPYINKCFEVSTGHITEADNALLRKSDEPQAGLVVYHYEEGCFVFVSDEILRQSREDLKGYGFSDAFCDLMVIARQAGCKYLQLDGDGIQYDDLPKFQW